MSILVKVQWLRTFFLMPLGWVDKEIAPYYQSPFYLKVGFTGSINC